MNRVKFSLLTVVLLGATAYADHSLEQVGIEETKMKQQKSFLDNSKSVDQELAKTLSKGSANYNESLKLLPSISVETTDPYSLTLDQNSIRSRGQFGDTFSKISNTIEGVPFSISVGQGANGYLVDLNNLESVNFYSGAMDSSKGLGFGNTAGSIDMQLKKPKDSFGFELEQSFGGDSYYKTFGRLDSGKLYDIFSLFGSGSIAKNDKWTGAGEIKRKNLNAMVTLDLTDTSKVTIFGAFNHFNRHEYKGLTFEQTKDLKRNYNNDFSKKLTGDPSKDFDYYDFNKQEMDEYFTMLNFETSIGDAMLSIKPYYFGNDGERLAGNPSNKKVIKMDLEQDVYGGLVEVKKELLGGLITAGWWYQDAKTIPPPISQKVYSVTNNGSLSFASYAMLTKVGSRTTSAPFLSYEREFGALSLNIGGKYMDFSFPSVKGYDTAGLGDISRDSALGLNLPIKSGMQVDKTHTRKFLPSIMMTYKLQVPIELRASYNKTYSNPWQGPLWSTYNSNSTKFQNAGISLQDIWGDLKLETADNYEVGAKLEYDKWYVATNLYYASVKNKQALLYDAVADLNYYKSDSKATSSGIELESAISMDNLDIVGSIYYNKYEFGNNLQTASNSLLSIKGNQIPNTPKLGAKLGLFYKVGDFKIAPILRYQGSRYGEIEHKERVDAYTVADLSISYDRKNFFDTMDLSVALDVSNIFDKKYIGIIKNDLDDSKLGNTTYYQGAPRSAMLSLRVSY